MRKRWFIAALIALPTLLVLLQWPVGTSVHLTDLDRPTLHERLQTGAQKLRAAKTLTDSRLAFVDVRAALRQMDKGEALDWILTQWRGGDDFVTELDLELGTGQNIVGWPSWRTFLLDMLFQIDPAAAGDISTELLGTSESPDEWAVAMRNLGRLGGHADLLKVKAAELLQRKEWQKNPSAGYLESFDVIVHTRHTALAPALLDHCDSRDEKAVRHASYLTLDRLLLAAPEKVLPELARNASLHPQSGLMLSNMVARADVRDPVQKEAVEVYLLDPKRTAEELRGFASVFPNVNMAVSDNLLTRAATVEGADLADRDRASLAVVAAWLADARFARWREPLQQSYQRLTGFGAN